MQAQTDLAAENARLASTLGQARDFITALADALHEDVPHAQIEELLDEAVDILTPAPAAGPHGTDRTASASSTRPSERPARMAVAG